MTSDVVLSAAMRSNLLSLQNIQNGVDNTQLRLSTGRKINSSLDGPQAFFASKALTNRANDLTRLLDGIGQSIQVIKVADNGVTALTKLVEQADSIASQAKDVLAAGQVEAKVTGDRDLSGINDLASLSGITVGDNITFTLLEPDGTAQEIAAYGAAGAATATVTITANMSTEQLMALINDIRVNDSGTAGANAVGQQAFEAKLNDDGQLEIKSLNGGSFRAEFLANTPGDTANFAFATELGFGNIARIIADAGVGTNNVEFTALADTALRSHEFVRNATGDVARRSDLLSDLRSASTPGVNLFSGIGANTDDYAIGINGGTVQNIELFSGNGTASVTIQDFIDDINNNSSLNSKIQASFDDATGQIIIKTVDASVKSIEIGIPDQNSAAEANFGFGVNADIEATATDGEFESIHLAAAAGDLAKLEADFNKVLDQMDTLVQDTGYRGTNLLNGDNLLTSFNEDRSSTLTTQGVTFTSAGLGIDDADFSRESAVSDTLDQVRNALASVREFGSTLANDLTVIQTRQTFTTELVNTLKEGSDKLVNADQNEEGAKLLALQTRQSLGVTALSLASQSQQSILRLF